MGEGGATAAWGALLKKSGRLPAKAWEGARWVDPDSALQRAVEPITKRQSRPTLPSCSRRCDVRTRGKSHKQQQSQITARPRYQGLPASHAPTAAEPGRRGRGRGAPVANPLRSRRSLASPCACAPIAMAMAIAVPRAGRRESDRRGFARPSHHRSLSPGLPPRPRPRPAARARLAPSAVPPACR